MNVNQFEIKRKLFHLIVGLMAIFLIEIGILNSLILGILVVISLIIFFIHKKRNLPVFSWFLKNFDRKEIEYPGIGALCLLIGIFLAVLLFENNIALAAIMIMTIGDAAACLFGIHFGKTKHPLNNKKILEATIVGIVLSFIGAGIFVNHLEAFIAAFFGMIVEAIELKLHDRLIIDDNLAIPLVAGAAILILRLFVP